MADASRNFFWHRLKLNLRCLLAVWMYWNAAFCLGVAGSVKRIVFEIRGNFPVARPLRFAPGTDPKAHRPTPVKYCDKWAMISSHLVAASGFCGAMLRNSRLSGRLVKVYSLEPCAIADWAIDSSKQIFYRLIKYTHALTVEIDSLW